MSDEVKEALEEVWPTERNPDGTFPEKTSGNPVGRPKGSKNRVTLLKLMAEEAVREKNLPRMLQVCERIIEDAFHGDKDMRKLVWQSIMSKGSADDQSQGKEKVTIQISTTAPEKPVKPDEACASSQAGSLLMEGEYTTAEETEDVRSESNE